MAAQPASAYRPPRTESGTTAKVVAVMLGLLVPLLGLVVVLMWADAREARAGAEAAAPATSTHVHAASEEATNTALPLNSFAGVVPANATELAEAHTAYDATLPRPRPATSRR